MSARKPLTKVDTLRYTLSREAEMTTERIKTIAYLQPKDRAGLDQLSEKTGATVSKLIEKAIQQYLKKEGK